MKRQSIRGPFSLANPLRAALPRALTGIGLRAAERMFGLQALNRVYHHAAGTLDRQAFCDGALESLGVSYEVGEQEQALIPPCGPLVVVSNHPFGAVDGVILHSLLLRARPDVKLFGSTLLARMEKYRSSFFFVDNLGGAGAAARNVGAMKAALRWLRDGGCIGVFPAGEVAHLTWRHPTEVLDPPWSESIARLAMQANAAVLPVFVEGRNSALFQAVGLIHPRLRTILLGREMARQQDSVVRVRVGSVIPAARVSRFASPAELTEHLRLRTYLLGERATRRAASGAAAAPEEPIAAETPRHQVARAIDALPSDRTLAELSDFAAICFAGDEAPPVLAEIGRLREITFRRAGEGTGRSTDIDRFDADYLHLFVWNRARREIVAAYRIGLTDELLRRRGIDGLYTSTLFRYEGRLLDQIGPAIELGRSFVRPEYQKDFAPLLLLWRGIGRWVAARPRYKVLFGPVSISNEYHSLSKHLLMRFLEQNAAAPELQRLVAPRNPPAATGRLRGIEHTLGARAARDVDEVDDLVREIESSRMSMPILLRQYLRLNAKLLAFNVDPHFGNVLDGLMLADLTQVDRQMLYRYMGRDHAGAFLRAHGLVAEAAATG